MAREEHVQAVGFAGLQVEELEGKLSALREETESVKATVVNAVGEDPSTPAGRTALQSVKLIEVALAEAMDLCEQAKQHLNDYGKGL